MLLRGIIDSNKELCCYSVDPSSIPPAGGQTTVETARLCHACAMRVNRYRRIPSPRQNLHRKTWPSGISAIGCNPGTGGATCPPVAEPLCCPPWVAAILPETGLSMALKKSPKMAVEIPHPGGCQNSPKDGRTKSPGSWPRDFPTPTGSGHGRRSPPFEGWGLVSTLKPSACWRSFRR